MRRGGKPPLFHHTALSHLHQYNGDTRGPVGQRSPFPTWIPHGWVQHPPHPQCPQWGQPQRGGMHVVGTSPYGQHPRVPYT